MKKLTAARSLTLVSGIAAFAMQFQLTRSSAASPLTQPNRLTPFNRSSTKKRALRPRLRKSRKVPSRT
jgi:hypothetical protein